VSIDPEELRRLLIEQTQAVRDEVRYREISAEAFGVVIKVKV
jgi:hypothetical protein